MVDQTRPWQGVLHCLRCFLSCISVLQRQKNCQALARLMDETGLQTLFKPRPRSTDVTVVAVGARPPAFPAAVHAAYMPLIFSPGHKHLIRQIYTVAAISAVFFAGTVTGVAYTGELLSCKVAFAADVSGTVFNALRCHTSRWFWTRATFGHVNSTVLLQALRSCANKPPALVAPLLLLARHDIKVCSQDAQGTGGRIRWTRR